MEKKEKLKNILLDVLGLKEDELDDSLRMEDVKKWDSLTHMDLISTIEEKLSIQLNMDEIMSMKDIKTIKVIVLKNNL